MYKKLKIKIQKNSEIFALFLLIIITIISTSYYNFEGDDSHTSLGWFFLIIEIIIASRIGMVIYHGNLKDGIGQHTNLLLIVIVICLGVYVLIEFVRQTCFLTKLIQVTKKLNRIKIS